MANMWKSREGARGQMPRLTRALAASLSGGPRRSADGTASDCALPAARNQRDSPRSAGRFAPISCAVLPFMASSTG
jgi:hypothetical protein